MAGLSGSRWNEPTSSKYTSKVLLTQAPLSTSIAARRLDTKRASEETLSAETTRLDASHEEQVRRDVEPDEDGVTQQILVRV